MRFLAVPLLLVLTSLSATRSPGTASAPAQGTLPAPVIPIEFTMIEPAGETPVQFQPVRPQPYQRKCGTIATDVCATNVAIPPGASGEQLYDMAAQAEAQRRKGDAMAYLEASAAKGYARAQSAIGIDYANGKGMPQNAQKAVYYLGLAAAQGNRGAQAKLGDMYAHGDGVTADQPKAIKYYEAAAAQHDGEAEFGLGVAYEFGNGVPHNRALAIQYLRRSSVDSHDTYGTELADVLAKTPASRQFHNFDELSAYLHPPVQLKAGACGPVPVLSPVVNRFGFSQSTIWCGTHHGCPWEGEGGGMFHCY